MKSANQHYRRHGMKEGDAGNIDPDDVLYETPADAHDYNEKPDIKESGLGREQGQMPKVEHEERFTQIDPESARHALSMMETQAKEFDTDDRSRVDERDSGNPSKEWDAERSRTGRHR